MTTDLSTDLHIMSIRGDWPWPAGEGGEGPLCFLPQNGKVAGSLPGLGREAEPGPHWWTGFPPSLFLPPQTSAALKIRNTFLLHTKLLPHTHFSFPCFEMAICCQQRLVKGQHMPSWPKQQRLCLKCSQKRGSTRVQSPWGGEGLNRPRGVQLPWSFRYFIS